MNISQMFPELLASDSTMTKKRFSTYKFSADKNNFIDSTEKLLNATIASADSTTKIPVIKNPKIYHCQRCSNHGRENRRKSHKSECPFRKCTCKDCEMVDKRRELESQMHEQGKRKIVKGVGGMVVTEGGNKERNPNCQRCALHGEVAALKGHKRRCPYSECQCKKCGLILQKRDLMARQIRLRRNQRKRRRKIETTKVGVQSIGEQVQASSVKNDGQESTLSLSDHPSMLNQSFFAPLGPPTDYLHFPFNADTCFECVNLELLKQKRAIMEARLRDVDWQRGWRPFLQYILHYSGYSVV